MLTVTEVGVPVAGESATFTIAVVRFGTFAVVPPAGSGAGWIGRCYGAFGAGIFLLMLGDVAIWATTWGYLPWPWSSLGWYVWVPAAAAFALAPAYQGEAMRHAESR